MVINIRKVEPRYYYYLLTDYLLCRKKTNVIKCRNIADNLLIYCYTSKAIGLAVNIDPKQKSPSDKFTKYNMIF